MRLPSRNPKAKVESQWKLAPSLRGLMSRLTKLHDFQETNANCERNSNRTSVETFLKNGSANLTPLPYDGVAGKLERLSTSHAIRSASLTMRVKTTSGLPKSNSNWKEPCLILHLRAPLLENRWGVQISKIKQFFVLPHKLPVCDAIESQQPTTSSLFSSYLVGAITTRLNTLLAGLYRLHTWTFKLVKISAY